MTRIDYRIDDSVALVTLNDGENRFNPDFIQAFIDTLDALETETAATSLVVTSAHEKIFSNGIDLDWLVPVIQQGNMAAAKDFFYRLNTLFKRTLISPLLTVAAINGHAFAGGAIWCCAFDFRLMRTDRGFFCFPEVDLGIPFLPGMQALLDRAIPRYKMEEMMLTGARLTAEECRTHHIVSDACHGDELLERTLAFARPLQKKRPIVKEFKRRLHKEIVHAIDVDDVAYIESEQFHIG
jgi:enoyl-CoA hydratase/carnithine racemase